MRRFLTSVRHIVGLFALLLPTVLIVGLLATNYDASITFVIGSIVGGICAIILAFWGKQIVNTLRHEVIFTRTSVFL